MTDYQAPKQESKWVFKSTSGKPIMISGVIFMIIGLLIMQDSISVYFYLILPVLLLYILYDRSRRIIVTEGYVLYRGLLTSKKIDLASISHININEENKELVFHNQELLTELSIPSNLMVKHRDLFINAIKDQTSDVKIDI